MLIHSAWTPGLRSHRRVSSRAALDPFGLRRPHDPHLELAVSPMYLCFDWPLSLRYVRSFPPL
jgi:hypothetical protein